MFSLTIKQHRSIYQPQKPSSEQGDVFKPTYRHTDTFVFLYGRNCPFLLASLITRQQHAFLLKLDLAKAFGRLEWSFITNALHRLGLPCKFIWLVHACIFTPTFSVLVNGEPTDDFPSQRGI
jgi:hypothetical protein